MLFKGDDVYCGPPRMAKAAERFVGKFLSRGDRVYAAGNVHLHVTPYNGSSVHLGAEIYLMLLTRKVVMFIPVGTVLVGGNPRRNLNRVLWFRMSRVIRFEYILPNAESPEHPELRAILLDPDIVTRMKILRIFPCSDTGLALCQLLMSLGDEARVVQVEDSPTVSVPPSAPVAGTHRGLARLGLRKPAR